MEGSLLGTVGNETYSRREPVCFFLFLSALMGMYSIATYALFACFLTIYISKAPVHLCSFCSLQEPGLFDFSIVNKDLSDAYKRLKGIALAARDGRVPNQEDEPQDNSQVCLLCAEFSILSVHRFAQIASLHQTD